MTKLRHPRQVGELFIDQSLPWGFFDGARQGQNDFSSPVGVLYLSSEYFNTFKAGLGVGSNNYAEMMAGGPSWSSKLLYLSNEHFINFKAGLGVGSDNYAELMALHILLKVVMDKGVMRLQMFGDSMVINLMNG